MYSDRTYTFGSIPSVFSNQTAIRTANDDKLTSASSPLLSFTLNQDANVYILYTNVNSNLESTWLTSSNGWLQDSFTVPSNLGGSEATRLVKHKFFPQGSAITLNGNGGLSSTNSMYTVVVVPGVAAFPTPPSAPANLTASAQSSTQINLSWTPSTDNVAVTGYRVERCSGVSCTIFAQISTPSSASFFDIGLSANTTYRYRVRAVDAAGNLSSYSAIISATTQAPPDTTPPVISSVSASSITSSGATVSWTTNEASDTQVEYGTTTAYGNSTALNSSLVTSHSSLVSGLSSNTTYNYRVKSRDAAGNLAISPNSTFTTLASVIIPPTGVKAFPTAEGFGANTVGGRGGRVIEVTNLNDAGPGSLRECAQGTGPRTCVFRVGGTITLKSPISIQAANSYVTIAGQTAPGGGIQLKHHYLTISYGAHDVIVRHLRVRPGTGPDYAPQNINDCQGISIYGAGDANLVSNVILDHVSVAWVCDDTMNIFGHTNNITLQWSLIGEGLIWSDYFSSGNCLGCGGANSKGLIVAGGRTTTASVHHNLFVHFADRVPNAGGNGYDNGAILDYRNNIVYNSPMCGDPVKFGTPSTDGSIKANIVGNRYVGDPGCGVLGVIAGSKTKVYVQDNWTPICPNDCANNQWKLGIFYSYPYPYSPASESQYRVLIPIDTPPVNTTPVDNLEQVLAQSAGATKPGRDSLDARFVQEFQTRTGDIGRNGDPWPVLANGTAPLDTDKDGMPDAWETARGLNPTNAADGAKTSANGYTHLENYLNELAGDPIPGTPYPSGTFSAAGNTFYLSPTGSDANVGISPASPWKRFETAIPKLQPGDTLLLLDGTYTVASNGRLLANCSAASGYPVNAQHGTAAGRITVKAQHERRALVAGTGADPTAILLCDYWTIEGLRIEGADNPSLNEGGDIVKLYGNHDVFRRNLLRFDNRYANTAAVLVRGSGNLIEENELYAYHRHGIQIVSDTAGSHRNIIRRNYCGGRSPDLSGGYTSSNPGSATAGDSCVGIYHFGGAANDTIFENNLSEGQGIAVMLNCWAASCLRTQVLGTISMLDDVNTFMVGRSTQGAGQLSHTTIENFLALNKHIGFYFYNDSQTRCTNCSALGAGGWAGFFTRRDYPSPVSPPISWTGTNLLSTHHTNVVDGSSGMGILTTADTTISYANGYQNTRNVVGNGILTNTSALDPKLGSCKAWIPDGSPLKGAGQGGADIGANILYAYENGVLTNKKLWDPTTNKFAFQGAVIPGVNDASQGSVLDTIGARLGIGAANGCAYPAGYVGGTTTPPSAPPAVLP